MFGVDPAAFLRSSAARRTSAPRRSSAASLPVTGLAVDQQAALFGEGCLRVGEAKCTYGTGAFLLANAGAEPRRSTHGLSASVAWDDDGEVAYCLDGQLYTVGRHGRLAHRARAGRDGAPTSTGSAAASLTPAASPASLRSPGSARRTGCPTHEDRSRACRSARPPRTSSGPRSTGSQRQVALLARATAQDLGTPIETLRVDGGLTQSRLLMQTQADLLQAPVEVFASPHATALGVAQFARNGTASARTELARGRDRRTVRAPRSARTRQPARLARHGGGDRSRDRDASTRGDRSATARSSTSRSSARVSSAARSPAESARSHRSCVLIEARNDVGDATSKANTAILHTGFDAPAGSLEARLVREGHRLLRSYADSDRHPHRADRRRGRCLDAGAGGRAARVCSARRRTTATTPPSWSRATELYRREPQLAPGA